MNNIAIIPARSGSKTLKDKNIKKLMGKPLIAYSIETAIEAKLFEEVMVSTDSKEYASIAMEYGAKVPFLRSKKNAMDTSSSWDVVREVVAEYKKMNKKYDTVCLLQPTSPLRTSQDIINAYGLYGKMQANTIISVCEAEHSPLWMNTLPESGSMEKFISYNVLGKRRQELNTYYRINGALYITRIDSLFSGGSLYENSYAYIMPQERSVDIDTSMDFLIADTILRFNTQKES